MSARTFPTGVGDDPGHIEPDDARHLSLRAYPMTPRDEVPDPVGERGTCVGNPGCFVLGDQLHRGCYELESNLGGFGFNADCNFCMPTPAVHETFPCKLLVSVSNQPALCNAFGPASAFEVLGDLLNCGSTTFREPRGFAMRFDADDADVEPGITREPFRSQTQYRYVLRGVKIHVAPCMDHPLAQNYCGTLGCYSTWLCKLFLWGGASGWKMLCNTPERATAGDPQSFRPDQYINVEKPFFIDADAGVRAPIFVELATTANGGCFQFTGPYCFTEACQQSQGAFPEWDCVGQYQAGGLNDPEEPWKPQRFLSRFYIDLSDDFGEVVDQEVYPHKNAAEVQSRNLQYAAIRDNMEQIDAPGHRSNHQYDSAQISRWRSHKSWTIAEAPHVLGGTARTRVRNKGIAAGLYLTAIRSNMHLHVERISDCGDLLQPDPPWSFRVHCSITITANYEWRRNAVTDAFLATMGLSFLTEYLDDWRIEDPDDPGVEHPSEFWYFRGSSGERINRKVEWRGVRAQWPYSAPNFKGYPCGGANVGKAGDNGSTRCCETYQMIHETTIFAEWNDFATALGDDGDPDPNHENIQRYAGFVSFALPGLNANDPEPQFTSDDGGHCAC